LKQKETRRLFGQEQYLPSAVIDRGSLRLWQEGGRADAFDRAKVRAAELIKAYRRPQAEVEKEADLRGLVERLAQEAGMEKLPVL
jgi:trimethylamine:corrinoid methyltransferase-like protein